jgi:serine/threonine-protein kinase
MPQPGETIADKYAILRLLGEGGMGVVYEATHLRLHQTVALKTLRPEIFVNPRVVARFEREARSAAQLRSRHAVRVLDVDVTDDGMPYIVLEKLEGQDLAALLATRRRLPIPEAVDYVLQACAAIVEAHGLGIIHRDLKPSNLFLAEENGGSIIKVLDFGISKDLTDAESKLTTGDSVVGTVVYASPEQLRRRTIDARSDIWSLGIALYELITGTVPFSGSTAHAAVAVISDPVPSIRKLRPDVPEELANIIYRALQKDPAARFDDVLQFANALSSYAPPDSAGAAAIQIATTGERSSPKVTPRTQWTVEQAALLPTEAALPAATTLHARRSPVALIALASVVVIGVVAVGLAIRARTTATTAHAAPDPHVADTAPVASPVETASSPLIEPMSNPNATASPPGERAKPRAVSTANPRPRSAPSTPPAKPTPTAPLFIP